jgi:hypothetical protein
MFPRAHVLKTWSLAWYYLEEVETIRGGVSGRKLGHWGHPLQGDCEISVSSNSPFLTFASQLQWAKQLCSHVLPAWCTTGPKSNMGLQPWTETSKTMSPNQPFLSITWIFQVFVIVAENQEDYSVLALLYVWV